MPVIGSLTLPIYGCYRCGYSWVPETGRVTLCPRCKSKLWNKPKVERSRGPGSGLGLNEIIGDRRDKVLSVVRRYHGTNPRVFGSVARGQAGRDSDLDLLLDFDDKATLFDRTRMRLKLEELLGREVDLVNEKALHWLAGPQILSEAVPI